jgi:N-methylhydantoinase B
MSAGYNPRTKRPFVCTHHNCKGGSGATEGFDGWNHTGPVSNMGGSRATDPEIFELAYPYRLLEYQLAADTGGAGQWRGGLGAVLRWRVDSTEVQCVTVGSGMTEETRAFGLFGAKPGSLPRMKVTRRDGSEKALGVNRFYDVARDDVFELHSQGGGGFGDPLARAPELVLEDVRNDYVTVRAALVEYGVVIDGANGAQSVNYQASAQERARRCQDKMSTKSIS